MATQQLLKKLTVKGILGAKLDSVIPIEDLKKQRTVKVCRIIGRANKAKPDSSKLGDFIRFGGEFLGINLLSGEIYAAGAAILPGIAESAVYGAMGQMNDKGQSESTVEFAFEIGAKYDETAATKYVYTVIPLTDPKPSDPMKALLESTGTTKALADKSAEPTKK